MRIFKSTLSLLLALLTLLGVGFTAFSAFAASEGFEQGDVIYVSFTDFSQWIGDSDFGQEAYLYINFTDNTRYDSGEKEKVNIGEDTERFNPRKVTENVSQGLYSYTVTAEDAGKTVLRFWRGSQTNLWNHSVALTFENFSNGFNTVVVTDYNDEAEGQGYLDTTVFYPYDINASLSVTPDDSEKNTEHTLKLSYETNVDVEVTYCFAIYANGEKISDSDTASFVPTLNYINFEAEVTAILSDGTVVAYDKTDKTICFGDFSYIGAKPDNLYAHGVSDGTEAEAWTQLQNVGEKAYFFLPSSVSENQVEILNTYNYDVKVNGEVIPSGEVKSISYSCGKEYNVSGAFECELIFMHSNAEAALFVNNDYSKTDSLWNYLCESKSNSTSAKAAIVSADGTLTDTDLKKIKGRGNTTWNADKKPFNLNFEDSVQVGTMQKTKQFSLLANFQDSAMCRNRILYDLGDAVGMRYSSDSRFVDFYVDGEYKGQYQMCQKIEAGKKNLICDVDDDGYIDENGLLKDRFSMLLEVPYGEDFYTSTASGIDVIIKSPDVEGNDNLYANEVKAYAKKLFDEMYTALKNNSDNLDELIDVDSFAKALLIQELGKNWDTHSWYLTYVPDENENYKFYAAPVWDFDNSIGNAEGVQSDLKGFGVTDYTEYTGWWCKYKKGSNNLSYLCTGNTKIMEAAKAIWFEDFVPALNTFAQQGNNSGEIYSYDVYCNYLQASAEMNYMIWNIEANNGWISDHSSLNKADFNYDTLTYSVDENKTAYDQYTFKGQFDYMADWLMSRSAWISEQWKSYLVSTDEASLLGDADLNGKISIKDATAIQKYSAKISLEDFSMTLSDVNLDGKVNVKDATAIQKHLAHIDTGLNIGKPLSDTV